MTMNAILPSLFGTIKMNSPQQSQSAICPSLFGTPFPSLFGTQQMNPQQELKLETERRSEELAKEYKIKLKIENDVRQRAILAAYSYTNNNFL